MGDNPNDKGTAEQRADQLRMLALALAEAEARERKRLAQLLHDHFQQLVSAAKLKTGLVRRQTMDEKSREGLVHVEKLLEEALSASRSLTIELSPPVLYDVGLNAAIEVLCRDLQKRHNLEIELNCDPNAEPDLEQVRVLLFDVVRELMHNVTTHAHAKRVSIVSRVTDSGQIEIKVTDDGVGFQPQSMKHELNRGTGSGRESSFGLMEIWERLTFIGGGMDVESEPKRGSTIRVFAPVKLRSAEDAKDEPEPRLIGTLRLSEGVRCRVIVADDHAVFREGIVSMLKQESWLEVVGEAADGAEALEQTQSLKPDILMLDISMPKMTGIEVAKIVSQELPATRIIMLSMHDAQDVADDARRAGAVAYLNKSVSSEILIAELKNHSGACSDSA